MAATIQSDAAFQGGRLPQGGGSGAAEFAPRAQAPHSRTTAIAHVRVLRPEIAAAVATLEFLARRTVEGFVSGRHRSPHKGFSAEFAEHRQYVPGDDLRDLDWRVLARTDRYFVKQYTEETNLRATILLDASGSMRYTGEAAMRLDSQPVSKFEYERILAAAFAYLLIQQQDAVGLVTFDTAIRRYIPPRARPSQMRHILDELCTTEASGETGLATVFHDIAERIPRRGVVVVMSDLFDDPEELLRAFHHFRYRKHELLVFHIMAEEEFTFPFDSFTHFRNLEVTHDMLEVDPASIKARYLENVRRFVRTIERGCGEMEADYVPVNTREDLTVALVRYLANRKRYHRW
ncbi:MAG: DUF58 domain-containing protein [Kiritimatiellia bacterium]